MDYEDYVCGNDRIYDIESNLSTEVSVAEPWGADEYELDPYNDWLYENEYIVDFYNDYE